MSRLVLITLVLASAAARADPLPASVRAQAVRRTGSIAIDGQLDEAAWASAPRQSGFTQRFPQEGAKATMGTAFALLYDDDAVYVGVWADDPDPGKIRRLLTRRDAESPADFIAIGIDSYHDHRTAYVFELNAAGVQRDQMLFDDSNQDDSWDAVWTGDVAVTDRGWTAEFKIPLNQLRFAGGGHQEWGFQVARFVGRSQELSAWAPWPRSNAQVVSKFGVLDGIEHVQPGRRLEILPYATGGFDVEPIAAGDPINDHVAARRNLGLDVKYGLGPAFTLSATINPDFGQVEADPSQVNLSANELFLAEKRPFFIEGVDLFKLPMGNGEDVVEGPFYSRRIGAAPAEPDMAYAYIKAPSATTIYGAAKLTGKTPGGWSVGVLDAVTGEESATIVDAAGATQAPMVAPLTNYMVARVKRDLRGGKTSLGASATAVDRSISGTPLDASLRDQAYTGGVQLQHRWDDNAWEADLSLLGSWVHGSKQAIETTQRLNRHLFQRPDASHVHVDPDRTSLAGGEATWSVGPMGQTKHWRAAFGGDTRTPGLELNDLGYQTTSDRIDPWLWIDYRDDDPGKTLLDWKANMVLYTSSTWEPQLLDKSANFYAQAQLTNYWSFHGGASINTGGWDPVELRGGAALRTNPKINSYYGLSTDSRKRVRLDLSISAARDWTADSMITGVEGGLTIQARSNIDLFVGPSWYQRDDRLQYVAQVADDAGKTHYIFATIAQTTGAMTMRVNWTFSPHLSLQAYAQPFIAAGKYRAYKDVDDPHATRFDDRFYALTGNDYSEMDGTLYVSHGGTYSFAKPDFDLGQLRSTMVLRWEYRPGSTVFAIWSHGQTHAISDGTFDVSRDLSGLARADSADIVMVKANYWIGL